MYITLYILKVKFKTGFRRLRYFENGVDTKFKLCLGKTTEELLLSSVINKLSNHEFTYISIHNFYLMCLNVQDLNMSKPVYNGFGIHFLNIFLTIHFNMK